MSYSSGNDDHRSNQMPDLPGDPYGRDTDLYPPVPEFPTYDYWDESNFDGNFDRPEPDVVIQARHSELPAQPDRSHSEDRVTHTPIRNRRGHMLRDAHPRQQRAASTSNVSYDEQAVTRRSPRSRARRDHDEVTRTGLQAAAVPADLVTGTRPAPRRRTRSQSQHRGGGNPAWRWSSIVMPSFAQMFEQALPTLIMALSALLGLLVIDRAPSLEGLWAPIVLGPSVAFLLFANKQVHPMWRRSALMNIAAVGVFYPLLIVRQSYLRVPYVEWGNGTLAMPLVATMTVVVLLVGIAFAAAWMSREDPEYAGVLFLPAALLVPFFAGATEIVSLRTALIVAVGVFLSSSILTVVASMLPGSYPMLIAPIALAIEFMVLPLSDSVPIFPMGAGTAAKLLFFVVLATTVGLTVAMPSLAGWVRYVRDLVNGNGIEPSHSR